MGRRGRRGKQLLDYLEGKKQDTVYCNRKQEISHDKKIGLNGHSVFFFGGGGVSLDRLMGGMCKQSCER